MAPGNENALLANCVKSVSEFHSLHRSKRRLWTAQPAFTCLEDPDQEDDDEDDQENGPQTDVHRYLLSVA
jgi:hypothetical protein